jgi:hypothetical protein
MNPWKEINGRTRKREMERKWNELKEKENKIT